MRAAKLTNKVVNPLVVEPTRYEVRDTTLGNLRVEIHPTGRRAFILRYSFANRDRKLVLGRVGQITTADARRLALVALSNRDGGDDPFEVWKAKTKVMDANTVNTVFERFMVHHVERNLRPKTATGYRSLYRSHVRPDLGRA